MITSEEFEACLPFVLKEEGGYSNTPGDHGGATDFGIIQSEYNLYRHTKGLSLQSVRLITATEYREIYWQSYWQPHCPLAPAGLNLSLFNINVNGGERRGVRLMQQSLGVTVDGFWGVQTMRALQDVEDIRHLIINFHDNERKFYDAIIAHDPSQQKFSADWHGRNDRCEKASLAMAGPAQPAV